LAQVSGPSKRSAAWFRTLRSARRSQRFRYDDSGSAREKKTDVSKANVSMNGVEIRNREFFTAIRQKREPNASLNSCCCYPVLDQLEKQLAGLTGSSSPSVTSPPPPSLAIH
jgi:hypothetical protein